MERFQELRELAKKRVHIADHILTQTFPLVKDPRLLVAVLENIFLGLTCAMGSVLHYERLFKRIPPFYDTFSSKYHMFVSKIAGKYHINKELVVTMREVKEFMVQHKKSPMEFSRREQFVICTDSYETKTLSLERMRRYLEDAKLFVEQMSEITKKEEAIFK